MNRALSRFLRSASGVLALVASAAFLAVACDIPEFDPPNILKQDRVLGVRSEPRVGAPGETVTFEAAVTNADGSAYLGPIAWIVTGNVGFSAGENGEELPDGDIFLQAPNGPPFVVTLPSAEDFEARYGTPYDPEGTVLTVAMAAGDPNDADALTAIKSFIVMDEPDKENPVFNRLRIQSDGADVEPDEYGITRVGNVATVKMIADAEFPTRGDNVTFHWYTATEGIEFSTDKAVEWKLPKKAGLYHVWCVARENSPTILAGGEVRVQSAGLDWRHEVIEITSGR